MTNEIAVKLGMSPRLIEIYAHYKKQMEGLFPELGTLDTGRCAEFIPFGA